MPMTIAEMQIRLSGGAANAAPNASLGGIMSSVAVSTTPLNNLFDNVTADQRSTGHIDYRCIYFRNADTVQTLQSARVFIDTQTPSSGTTIDIGLAAGGKNVDAPAIANETTAPAGVTFVPAANDAAALALTNMAPNDRFAIWVRRTTAVGTLSAASDDFTLRFNGTPS